MKLDQEESRTAVKHAAEQAISGMIVGFVLWLLVFVISSSETATSTHILRLMLFVAVGFVIAFLKELGTAVEIMGQEKLRESVRKK